MKNLDNVYILTREELKQSGASNFKHGDIIICGKYCIHITYKTTQHECRHASMLTTVNTRENLRDLPMSKQPQFIRDFIEDYNIERVS